jgi:AbrB family looped-hinge helix DNA binding protein
MYAARLPGEAEAGSHIPPGPNGGHMPTGIVRKIDDLGRVVIPAEYRRVLGIKEGDELEIELDNDRVSIRPRYPRVIAEFDLDSKTPVKLGGSTIQLDAGEYVIERIDRTR